MVALAREWLFRSRDGACFRWVAIQSGFWELRL